jgi:hypothetical protein
VFAAMGIVASLIANAVTHDQFLVGAVCVLLTLVGMLLQELTDGLAAAGEAERARRRRRRQRARSEAERERARRERERDRDRIAA